MAATDHLSAGLEPRPGLASLLIRPRRCWSAMAGCGMTGGQAFVRYALALAAIPALAKAAGVLLLGVHIDGVLLKPSPIAAGVSALLTYGLDLVSVLLLGLAIHVFAPVFDGERQLGPAMKLAVVGSIPGWLGGIFLVLPAMGLAPPLGALSVMATLYGLYVLYVGLPPVMHVMPDKVPVYGGLAIVVFLALWGADSLAVSAFDRIAMTPAPGATLYVGKDAKIDVAKAKKQLDQALRSDLPQRPPASPDELERLLPQALDSGFTRDTITSSSAHVGKLSGAMAQGSYHKGGDLLTLAVVDTGAVGGLAEAVKLATNKHTATGYEKGGEVDGRMTLEKYERTTNTGEFDILVANRFLVQAKGRASVEILQAATRAVDFERLEALARG